MACADVRSWVTNGLGAEVPRRLAICHVTPTGRPRPAVTNLATIHYDSLVPREWFGKVSMQRINVLSIQRISAEDRAKIEGVDRGIELTDAGGWSDGEI